jgi:hypothetical protein
VKQESDPLIIYNQEPPRLGGGIAPPFMIKTDINVIPGRINEISKLDPRASRKRTVKVQRITISGQPAIREWWDEGELSFPNGITTYIPTQGNETIALFSFYNPRNQAAESAILRLHNTMKLR